MTLDPLRERILRAKQQELTQTVLARKRKLRELYAVASALGPIPDRADVDHDDAPLISADEAAFLDANDILKGRSFDESTLPARRSSINQTEPTSHDNTDPPPVPISVPPPMVPSPWQGVEVLAPPKTVTVTETEHRPPTSLTDAMTHDDDDDDVVRLGRGPVQETPSRQTLVASAPRPDGPPSPPSTQSPPDEPAIDKQVEDVSSGEAAAGIVTHTLPSLSPPKPLQPLTELVSYEQEEMDRMPDQIASTMVHPASRPTRRDGDGRHQKRLKISNVILEKRRSRRSTSSRASRRRASKSRADRDYMLPLCVAQAYTPPRAPTLNSLVMTAHKAISTQDQALDRREQQVTRILKRVWQLQHANTWSLRQIPRAVEPHRPPTHWDALMDHVRDMRTDFRQDKAWRTTAARNLARWCADWVQRAPSDRRALQVRVRLPSRVTVAEEDGHRPDPAICLDVDEPPPTLKEEDRSWPPTPSRRPSPEASVRHPHYTAASATLFTLDSDQVSFAVQKTLFGDPLLNKLPLHRAVDGPSSEPVSDASWKLPIVPISKFVTAKVALPPLARSSPKRKRDAGDVGDGTTKRATGRSFRSPEPVERPLNYANGDPNVVLLFDPEYQLMRDRIHAGHAFRPPAEHPMPPQSFFESRHPSQWTAAEEDQLRDLVEEYAYNWSLISSMLSSKSMFSSGAERRTPWECFERWVGLEGLPPEMQRTPYFRLYQARLEAAQRKTMPQPSPSDASNATMIAATTPTVAVAPARSRPTEPMRIERRKRTRHLSLIDAMKKLAKQRETSLQKQQHAASMAAMRKANVDPAHPRLPVQTPQEFSRIKYERDVKSLERAEAYRQQVYAQQRAAFQQQRSAQQPAAPPVPTTSAAPPTRNGHIAPPSARSPHASAAPSSGPVLGVFSGQPSSHPSVPQPPANNLSAYGNGIGSAHAPHAYKPMAVKSVPQAHMQPGLPGHQRPSQPMTNDMRVQMENNRIQQEQRRLLQQQQQQGGGGSVHFQAQPNHGQIGPASSPIVNNGHGLGGQMAPPSNSAMLATFQAASNPQAAMTASTTNNTNIIAGPASSPRMTRIPHSQISQPQSLSGGMTPAISAISHEIKARHLAASPEQIKRMTNEQMAAHHHRLSLAAMNAAAGGSSAQGLAMVGDASHHLNQQRYAQNIRAQQASQSKTTGSNIPNGVRTPSRGATPQTQRLPNVQASPGPGHSPRVPQAQMTRGQ